MSAVEILINILSEIGLEKSSPQISSSTDVDIIKITRFMNQTGEDLALRGEWSKLIREFTTGSGFPSSAIPVDFLKLAEYGSVSYTNGEPLRRVDSVEMFNTLSKLTSSVTFYQLRQGVIYFSKVIALPVKLTYFSKYWVIGNMDKIDDNGDDFQFPGRLLERGAIWRWKREMGLPYEDDRAEFEAMFAAELASDRNAR